MDDIGLMSETINFIQGSKRNYDSSTMQGGVYFSKDSKEILLNGESYGNAVPADEEDLTSVNGALQLKDREVNANNFQSKGYVILRKNLVQQKDGSYKNILTQDMISQPNTTYEIRYDFDCNNATINFNCNKLVFNGGSIINGVFTGEILNDVLKPEWFGAKGDGITDDRKAIQNTFDICKNSCRTITVLFSNKTYYVGYVQVPGISYNLVIPTNIKIIGDNTKFKRKDLILHYFIKTYESSYSHNYIANNVNINDTEIIVNTIQDLRIGDKILIRGEDGETEDKAEPSYWEFNYIDNIENNTITLKNPIGSSIDLTRVNQSGSVSNASVNGTITKVNDGTHVEIRNIEDITESTEKKEAFIVIKYASNVIIDNVRNSNQTPITLQYCSDCIISNVDGYNTNSSLFFNIWETKNISIYNCNYTYVNANKNTAVFSVEGFCQHINIDNFYLKYDIGLNNKINFINALVRCEFNINNLHITGNSYTNFLISFSALPCKYNFKNITFIAPGSPIIDFGGSTNQTVSFTGNVTFKDNLTINWNNKKTISVKYDIYKDKILNKKTITFKDVLIYRIDIINSNINNNKLHCALIDTELYTRNIELGTNFDKYYTSIQFSIVPSSIYRELRIESTNAEYSNVEFIFYYVPYNNTTYPKLMSPNLIGETSERPLTPTISQEYYDTTLNKQIVYNGTEWVNVDGTSLEKWTTIE